MLKETGKHIANGDRLHAPPDIEGLLFADRNLVQMTAPKHQKVVHLPRFWIESWDVYGAAESTRRREVLAGMHTDNLSTLVRQISHWKEAFQKGLYIQCRLLTPRQYERLCRDALYNFFLRSRSYRSNLQMARSVWHLIVPNDVKLTDEQVRKYAGMTYTPDTGADRLGYVVGWVPAAALLRKWEWEGTSNALRPLLGGVNQFFVGSDTLKPNIVNALGAQLSLKFEHNSADVMNTAARLGDKLILAANRKVLL